MRSNDLMKASTLLREMYDHYLRVWHSWYDSDDQKEKIVADVLKDVSGDIEDILLQSNFDRNKIMTELSIRDTKIAELELEINQLKKELNK